MLSCYNPISMIQRLGGFKGSQDVSQRSHYDAKYNCKLLVLQIGQSKLYKYINATSSLHGRQPSVNWGKKASHLNNQCQFVPKT